MAKTKSKTKLQTFTWSGLDKGRQKASGQLEAASLQIAKLTLRRQGIRVKTIRKRSQPLFIFGLGPRIKVKEIVVFTRQLATMIQSGIPIAGALRGITLGQENESVKKLINTIREDVEAGTALSLALKRHPGHFNRLYTSLVTVGEESGTLDTLMNKVAVYMEKMEDIKKKIRSALTYPILVLAVSLIVIVILLVKVIPEFENLFQGTGTDLPALTRWIIGASDSVQKYWFRMLVGIMLFSALMVYIYRRSPKMQHSMDRVILRFPVFGPLIRKALIARVARTLSIMFEAGVPLVDSLGTVSQAATNRIYSNAILQIRSQVSTGRTLEAAMADTGLFPGMMVQMVATGEETGELGRMLDRSADFLESEVDAAVASISSLVEPFLIVTLGIILGTMVIAMYLPIFKLGGVF